MKLSRLKNIIKQTLKEQSMPAMSADSDTAMGGFSPQDMQPGITSSLSDEGAPEVPHNSHRQIQMEICESNSTSQFYNVGDVSWYYHSMFPNIGFQCDGLPCSTNDIGKEFETTLGLQGQVTVKFKLLNFLLPIQCPTPGECRQMDPASCDGSTGTTKCTEKDFQYNATPCGQTHLVPAPGGAGSWQGWLNAQWNAYSTGITQTGQPVECFQFGAIITYTTDQLNSGVTGGGVPFTQVQIDRKEAKRDWAVCMVDHCDCKGINTTWGDDSFRCVDGNCVSCGGPGCPYPTLDDCKKDCGPRDRPCDKFNAAPVAMQNGCCGKCINGVYTGTAGDPCDVLTQSCKCCPDDNQGDERGCLDPNALNNGQCCPQNNYPGCVPTIQYDECCEYDDRGGDPCKTFYAMPQAYQDGCCEKCQGNISPADPCYQYCKCCDPIISTDPCKDNPNPECFWCFEETSQGGPCQPVGGNLQYALNNGINLYSTQAACTAAEPGCRRDDIDPQMIVCHKCANGYPVSNQFPGPNCPPGWQSMPPFDPKKCKPGGPTDPSDPVDMVDPGMERMKTLMEYKKPK